MNPQQLLYTKTHEWADIQPDPAGGKIATVGLTAFAIEVLTDLVFMSLPEIGRQVKAGEPFGEIESVKAVSDLYSPVDGQIVAVNADLVNKLETLSKDPYQVGWLVKIKITNEKNLANLLDFAAYQKQCEQNNTKGRMRDEG